MRVGIKDSTIEVTKALDAADGDDPMVCIHGTYTRLPCERCDADAEDTITVPRDQFELYKEKAEAWADGQLLKHGAICTLCGMCAFDGSDLHAADCKAARILNLKREWDK